MHCGIKDKSTFIELTLWLCII